MKGHGVAAFGRPRLGHAFTAKGDMLEPKARLVADYGPGAALALQAVAHGDARWFAVNCQMKLATIADGASRSHRSAPCLSIWGV
jgi:hypothetical protein